jgi:hypothetical protein
MAGRRPIGRDLAAHGHVTPQDVFASFTQIPSQVVLQQYESKPHTLALHVSHPDTSFTPDTHSLWAQPPPLLATHTFAALQVWPAGQVPHWSVPQASV